MIYIFGFTAYSSVLRNLEVWLIGHPAFVPVFFALAAASYLALSRWEKRELGVKAVLDYEDPVEPVVRILGLSTR